MAFAVVWIPWSDDTEVVAEERDCKEVGIGGGGGDAWLGWSLRDRFLLRFSGALFEVVCFASPFVLVLLSLLIDEESRGGEEGEASWLVSSTLSFFSFLYYVLSLEKN